MARSDLAVMIRSAKPWRALVWLLVSTFMSSIGRNGYALACAWTLVASGRGSTAVAFFFAIISVTELATSLIAGWIADRFPRSRVYCIADALRLSGALLLAAGLMAEEVEWAIWLSAILFASCDRIALTASQAMIPSVSARLSLEAANSICLFTMQAGSLLAAILTGIVLHVSTPSNMLMIIAATFALSVAGMHRVRLETGKVHMAEMLSPTPRPNRRLVHLGAIYALLYTGGVLVSILGPGYVLEELKGNALDFGHLESAWSAGSILGAVLLIPLARISRLPRLLTIILALSALTFGMLKSFDLPWALAAFAILGALYNLGRVATEVMLQETVDNGALGRAKGVFHCAGVGLGLVLFGLVALFDDQMMPSTIFALFSILLLAATIIVAILKPR